MLLLGLDDSVFCLGGSLGGCGGGGGVPLLFFLSSELAVRRVGGTGGGAPRFVDVAVFGASSRAPDVVVFVSERLLSESIVSLVEGILL